MTLLLTEAVGLLFGPVGGLTVGTLLLTAELAGYAAKRMWEGTDFSFDDANTTETIAYITAPAICHVPNAWPVDVMLGVQFYWVFMDDAGADHAISVYVELEYYSYYDNKLHTISTKNDPVTIWIYPDIGNTFQTAKPIAAGEHLGCLDTYDEVDMYKISVQYNQIINVWMTPPGEANFDIRLYNPDMREVASSTKPGNATEFIGYQAKTAGWWYINVSWSKGKGIYSLKIALFQGGGGCPFICVWNGTHYRVDNNLLPATETGSGADVEDWYRLEQPFARRNGKYCLLLGEFGNEHSYIDTIKLIAVGHAANINVALNLAGEIITYENPYAPTSAVDQHGNSWLTAITTIDNNYYEGNPNGYLLIDFKSLDAAQHAKLVLRANLEDSPKSPCIHVQVLNHALEWVDVAVVQTRKYMSTQIVDLSNYLPNTNGSLKVRLYFTARHRIDYVGLDTTPPQPTTICHANLAYAFHSTQGDVKEQLMKAGGTYAQLLPNQQIELAFTLPQNTKQARTFILYTKGRYYTITN